MKNPIVDLYLVGVIPEYQNKGVNALLFATSSLSSRRTAYAMPRAIQSLRPNAAVQMQWNYFERKHHKTRRAWIKEI